MQGGKNTRKGKQMNKCRKSIIGLKKLKIYKREKKKSGRRKKKGKKGKLHRTAKAHHKGRGL